MTAVAAKTGPAKGKGKGGTTTTTTTPSLKKDGTPRKQRGPRGAHVHAEIFVENFQNCNTRQEVAERLRLSLVAVYAREKSLRAKGVQLKEMTTPGRRGLNIERLNKICRGELSHFNKSENQNPVVPAPQPSPMKGELIDSPKQRIGEGMKALGEHILNS